MKKYDRYIARLRELGANDAVAIDVGKVVVADWVLLKCRYGCREYGRHITCPPHSPTPERSRKILSEYSAGLLVRFTPETSHADFDEYCSYKSFIRTVGGTIERELFLDGFYKAFAMTSGPCKLCKTCRGLSRKTDRNIVVTAWNILRGVLAPGSFIPNARRQMADFLNAKYTAGICVHPNKARPAMEAMGIDVYATVRAAGLQIEPLRARTQLPSYYCLILIE